MIGAHMSADDRAGPAGKWGQDRAGNCTVATEACRPLRPDDGMTERCAKNPLREGPTDMKAALYLRVSTTNGQTTENQRRELEAVANRLGHEIIEVYEDNGISGAKGRDKRPAFDRLHRDVTRRKFDIVMAWSVDRLGRSLQDLVHFLDHLHAKQVGLYLHQRGIDTTTPAGKAMF